MAEIDDMDGDTDLDDLGDSVSAEPAREPLPPPHGIGSQAWRSVMHWAVKRPPALEGIPHGELAWRTPLDRLRPANLAAALGLLACAEAGSLALFGLYTPGLLLAAPIIPSCLAALPLSRAARDDWIQERAHGSARLPAFSACARKLALRLRIEALPNPWTAMLGVGLGARALLGLALDKLSPTGLAHRALAPAAAAASRAVGASKERWAGFEAGTFDSCARLAALSPEAAMDDAYRSLTVALLRSRLGKDAQGLAGDDDWEALNPREQATSQELRMELTRAIHTPVELARFCEGLGMIGALGSHRPLPHLPALATLASAVWSGWPRGAPEDEAIAACVGRLAADLEASEIRAAVGEAVPCHEAATPFSPRRRL